MKLSTHPDAIYSRRYARLNPEKTKEYKRKYYQKHKDEIRLRTAKYRAENPDLIKKQRKKSYTRKIKKTNSSVEISIRHMLPLVKARAKQGKKKFGIDFDYCLRLWNTQKGRCKLSGLPMSIGVGSKGSKFSIDRIDSKKGYVVGNCQIVRSDVNISKNIMSQKDFIKMCKAVAKNN